MVGDWYLHSQSAHGDARVIEAYRQLQVETDRLFSLLCGERSSRATRVAFTRCVTPYESDEELIVCGTHKHGLWRSRLRLSKASDFTLPGV